LLVDAGFDAIGFACTAGSLIGGLGYDRTIARMISSETGVDATTTASSVIDALRTLGIRRLALLAPYEQWLIAREVHFLEASGFTVVGHRGLDLPRARDCEAVSSETIRRYARELDTEEADAVFISCADFQALAVAGAIEDDLGKPVVTSNQAIIWKLLRMAGLNEAVEGYGQLLRQ
jgi:maleate isomerase